MQGVLVQSLVRKTRSHIPHATGQLSLCMETTEPVCHNKVSHVPQLKPNIVPVNIQVHHTVSQPDQSMEVLFRKIIQYLCPVKFTVSSPVMIFSLTVAFFLVSHSAILNSVCPWFSWYLLRCSSPSLDNHSVSGFFFFSTPINDDIIKAFHHVYFLLLCLYYMYDFKSILSNYKE